MSRKRLIIWIVAALLLAIGTTACSIGGDDETTTVTVSDTTESETSSGKTVKIIASVPPTDHGWLGAISKETPRPRPMRTTTSTSSCCRLRTQIPRQQIEQAIAQKPDVLVAPQDGAALTPVAQKAERRASRWSTSTASLRRPTPRRRPCSATTTRSAFWRRPTSPTS